MRVLTTAILCVCTAASSVAQLPCHAVPGEAFVPATGILANGLPEGARLAGAGRTLGILVPRLPDGHTLLLVRGGKVVRESWLGAPKDPPFARPPAFLLADDGNIVILRSRSFFAVYIGSALSGVVRSELAHAATVTASRSELFWGPSPGSGNAIAASILMGTERDRFKPEEWPALLVRSELDGSNPEVLLRLDEKRLAESEMAVPLYHEIDPALRSDGKLWLTQPFLGKIALATASGRILQSLDLPGDLKRPEDDPETRKKMEEDIEREAERIKTARSADATRRPPTIIREFSGHRSRLFSGAFARGRDLVLSLATATPPPPAVLLLRDGHEQPVCFQFPHSLSGKAEAVALQLAVTDDAVWFGEPFGFVTWESLEALVTEQADKPAALGTTSTIVDKTCRLPAPKSKRCDGCGPRQAENARVLAAAALPARALRAVALPAPDFDPRRCAQGLVRGGDPLWGRRGNSRS